MDNEFDDIRPYRDDEVPAVIARLASNDDFIRWMQHVTGEEGKVHTEKQIQERYEAIKKMVLEVRTVRDYQHHIIIEHVVKYIEKNSTDGITSSGIENLSKDGTYLFVSNHRDITFDPALVCYTLWQKDFETVEIAFGDNLMITDFIGDMIRVNKSFIVKRNLPIDEMLKAAKKLSRYIGSTLDRGNSVWIAQREGRAKDGNDLTNPAIIMMFYLSQRDGGVPFPEYMKKLTIVPVSISYEFDPCDKLKGFDMYKIKNKLPHKKGKYDDLVSMNKGLTGYKGRIHLSYSRPLTGDYKNEKEVATAIDSAIQKNYRLWPSNYIACDELSGSKQFAGEYTNAEKDQFLGNYAKIPETVRTIILESYANPVKNYYSS